MKRLAFTPSYFVIALLWVIPVLIVFEVFLRATTLSIAVSYRYDPEWGNETTAGSYTYWGTEGGGLTEYGPDGEVATPYSGGANVVVIGDSFTEALQVDNDEKYVSLAERELRNRGIAVDLRNLGSAGSSIADYVYLAPLVKKRHSPSLVVIQLNRNDFLPQEEYDPGRTNHFERDKGSLRLVHVPEKPKDSLLGNLRRAVILLDYGLTRFEQIRAAASKNGSPAGPAADGEFSARGESDHDSNLLLLDALHDAYDGVPVVILPIPSLPPSISGSAGNEEDPEYLALQQAMVTKPGWKVVDLSNAFDPMLRDGRYPRGFSNSLPNEGHLNAEGNRVVGELLADYLEVVLR